MSSNCLAVYPKHNLLREQKISQYTQVVIEAQSYVWRDEDERLYWRKRAEKMLREHMRGQKSVLVEAALRAHAGTRNTRLVESRLLSEGFFSKIADGLGKATVAVMKRMPGYKTSRMRNWWIFGGGGADEDKRYEEAYKQAQRLEMTEKARAAIGQYFKAFDEKITQAGNVFPNIEGEGSGDRFKEVIDLVVKAALAVRIYAGDTKVTAELKDAGISGLPKVEDVKDDVSGYVITKEEGNQLIAGLRKRLMYWDRNLEQRYALAMEHVSYKVPTLAEAYGLNEADEDKKPTADDLGKKGKETSTMEYLKSNVLPGFLAALGASGLALSWLAHQDWFISHFMEMVEEAVPTTYSWEDAPGPPSLERLPGLAGEAWSGGATQYFRNFTNLPFEPGANISSMKLLDMAHVFRAKGLVDIEGHPTEKLLSLAVDRDAFQRDWMKHVVGNLNETNMTLGEALPLSSAWGKAGGTLTLKVAGAMKAVWPKALKIIPGKGAVWALSSTGTALVAAAPWLAGVGAVLLVAGIGSKLMRRYGAKNSRASKISAALKMIDDINLPDQTPPPDPTPTLPPSSTEEALKDPKNIERVKEACANFDDPRLAKALELLEAIAAGKVVREPPPAQQPLVNIIINGTVNGNVTVEYITKAIEGTLRNEPRVKPEVRDIVSTLTGEAQAEESNDEKPSSNLSRGEKLFAQLVFYKTLKDLGYDPAVDYKYRSRTSKEPPEIVMGSRQHLIACSNAIQNANKEEDLEKLTETYFPRGRLTLVEAIYGSSQLLEASAPTDPPSTGSTGSEPSAPGAGSAGPPGKGFEATRAQAEKFLVEWNLIYGALQQVGDTLTPSDFEKAGGDKLLPLFLGFASWLESTEKLGKGSTDNMFREISRLYGNSKHDAVKLTANTFTPPQNAKEVGDFLTKISNANVQFAKSLKELKAKVDTDAPRNEQPVPAETDSSDEKKADSTLSIIFRNRTDEMYISRLISSAQNNFKESFTGNNLRKLETLKLDNKIAKIKKAIKKLQNFKTTSAPSAGSAAGSTPTTASRSESNRRRDDVILERWAILAGINRTEARR